MRVWCLGAGGVGGCIAVRLQRAGVETLVFDTDPVHVQRMRQPGLEVAGLEGGAHTWLDAHVLSAPLPAGISPPEVLFLAVPVSATEHALRSLLPALHPDTDVVTLQNSLSGGTVAALVGSSRTIISVVDFKASYVEPGRISLDAMGDVQIGRIDGSIDVRLETVRQVLGYAFTTTVGHNVRGELWTRALGASIGELAALAGMPVDELLSGPERRRLVADILAEGVRVASADGVGVGVILGQIDPAAITGGPERWQQNTDRALVHIREGLATARAVSGHDLGIDRPNWNDGVAQDIVRTGAQRGVPTPLYSAIDGIEREIAARTRAISPVNLQAVGRPASGPVSAPVAVPPSAPVRAARTKRSGPPRALVVGAVVVLALVLVGFLALRRTSKPSSTASGPGAAGNAPPRAAAPLATPGVVNEAIQTIDGNTINVRAVEAPARPNREVVIQAEKGTQFAVVDVEFCVRKDFGSPGTVTEGQFHVRTPDGHDWVFWDTPDFAKAPRFGTSTTEPGKCTRGWITFQVPEGSRVARVWWAPAEGSPQTLSWKVPG